ncbi:MAG: DUF4286 family protein [Bacteroidetes bacterium]|jgi:hypothetical protein|nr:DUF4286 family protein [Bacteroidota bacterium]
MIIYNVTVNIDNDVHDDWLQWMTTVHVPDVVATGCFTDGNIFKIMVDEQQGTSYSIQYKANSMDDVNRYLETFAPALREQHTARYKDKFVAFRTLLQHIG